MIKIPIVRKTHRISISMDKNATIFGLALVGMATYLKSKELDKKYPSEKDKEKKNAVKEFSNSKLAEDA